jgi:hypothetical protein
MKKILIITILIFFSVSLYCQESKFILGIDIAPTYSSLHGNEFINQNHNSRVILFGGITAEYLLANNFSLKTGIGLERKGSKIDLTYTDSLGNSTEEETVKFNFDYLTFPFLLRFTFGQKIKYYANAGVYLGYLIDR